MLQVSCNLACLTEMAQEPAALLWCGPCNFCVIRFMLRVVAQSCRSQQIHTVCSVGALWADARREGV